MIGQKNTSEATAGQISDALGPRLPRRHLLIKPEHLSGTGHNIGLLEQVANADVNLLSRRYCRLHLDQNTREVRGLEVGCIRCNINQAINILGKEVVLTIPEVNEDASVIQLTFITPYGLSNLHKTRTHQENSDIKLLITGDFVRLLLQIKQISDVYSQATDIFKDNPRISLPEVIIVQTNQRMARFMVKRLGFSAIDPAEQGEIASPSDDREFHLYIRFNEAMSLIPKLLDYLKELKQRETAH